MFIIQKAAHRKQNVSFYGSRTWKNMQYPKLL